MKNIPIKSASITIAAIGAFVVLVSASAPSSASAQAQLASTTPTAVIRVATSSCPVVVGFMKAGAPNDPAEVAKLQAYLRSSQGSDVDVTGIFDQKTEAAVSAFQRKYMSEVMGPWGATRPSGVVYLTTAKKLNQLACGAPLTLDPTEFSIIDGYRKAAAAAESQQLAEAGDETVSDAILDAMELGSGRQAASAALADGESASIVSRFFRFLTRLF